MLAGVNVEHKEHVVLPNLELIGFLVHTVECPAGKLVFEEDEVVGGQVCSVQHIVQGSEPSIRTFWCPTQEVNRFWH